MGKHTQIPLATIRWTGTHLASEVLVSWNWPDVNLFRDERRRRSRPCREWATYAAGVRRFASKEDTRWPLVEWKRWTTPSRTVATLWVDVRLAERRKQTRGLADRSPAEIPCKWHPCKSRRAARWWKLPAKSDRRCVPPGKYQPWCRPAVDDRSPNSAPARKPQWSVLTRTMSWAHADGYHFISKGSQIRPTRAQIKSHFFAKSLKILTSVVHRESRGLTGFSPFHQSQ